MENNFNMVKLKDVLNEKGYIRGPFGSDLKRSEMLECGIPVYEQSNAIYNNRRFRYFIDGNKFEKLKRFQVKADDIIISCSGTVGCISIIKESDPLGIISQALLILRPNRNIILPEFLMYFFKSNMGRNSILSRSSGSVQVNIAKRDIIENIDIYSPNISEQEKVVTTLSLLDKKIDINNEMNKTLEEMAQAIFKSWFVDFEPFKDGEFEESELGMIPCGWKVGVIGDFIDINPRTEIQKGKTYKFVDMANVPINSVRINTILEKEFTGGGTRFQNNDLIFARITPCLENGKTAIIDFLGENEVSFGSTEFIVFRGIEWNSMYYSYCLARYDVFRTYAIQHMNGSSGRQRVSKGDIENYKIVIPPKEILLKFNKFVSSYFEKMKKNDACSKTLRNIRDTLLPKLISGEIQI